MLKPKTDTFIACDADYADAKVILFGAPYDSTTSFRPGARFGCSAIRHESFGLETYSPYQNRDLTDYFIMDSGDMELCFGDQTGALNEIETRTAGILNDGKLPFLIGGEHLVTLGGFRAAVKRFPDIHLIQFDAHADLRDDYLGNRLSHACVMRRCFELMNGGEACRRLHQFGIRSGERGEFDFAREHTNMHQFTADGLEETLRRIGDSPVYLTVDLDVVDPGFFPGTGTPEAGGFTFMQFLDALLTIARTSRVVALDVTELAPTLDLSGASTALAGKLVRELLLALQK